MIDAHCSRYTTDRFGRKEGFGIGHERKWPDFGGCAHFFSDQEIDEFYLISTELTLFFVNGSAFDFRVCSHWFSGVSSLPACV